MKTLNAILVLLAISTSSAPAVPGLKVSVQCPDVVLSWPSTEGSSYYVFYRPNLDPSTPWEFKCFVASDWGTNVTHWVDYGASPCPPPSMTALTSSTSLSKTHLHTRLLSAEALMPPLPPPPPPRRSFTNRILSATASASSTVEPAINSPQPGPSPQDLQPPDCGFYQVVMPGANPYTLSNGMVLSGVVTIPLELGSLYAEPVFATLTDYDEAVGDEGAFVEPPFARPVPSIVIDTTRLTNGVHMLSGFATFHDGSGESSAQVAVIVSNLVSYPDYFPWFGEIADQLRFTAQVACNNITYRLDIYDSHTNYVTTLTNASPDGNISVIWDLTDANGVTHTDPVFNFKLTAYSGGVPLFVANPPPLYKNLDTWPGPGGWVVANQEGFPMLTDAYRYQQMADRVAQIPANLGLPQLPRGGGSWPLPYYADGSSNAWWQLKQALWDTNSRNFYYFGHGSNLYIGEDYTLRWTEVSTNLTSPANYHRYRFVYLDCCWAGIGPMSRAFGIKPGRRYALDELNCGIRPSFFAGYKRAITTGVVYIYVYNNKICWTDHWLTYWALGEGIVRSFDFAAGALDAQNVSYDKMTKNGVWELTINGYNR